MLKNTVVKILKQNWFI